MAIAAVCRHLRGEFHRLQQVEKALKRAVLITLRRAIYQRFPSGPERDSGSPGWRRYYSRVSPHATVRKYLLPAVLIVGLGYFFYTNRSANSDILTPLLHEVGIPVNPLWNRPALAPNGSQWPQHSEYIAGYQRLNVFGPANVVADNSGGSSDLFAKLIDRDRHPMMAVRVFLVSAHSRFTLRSVKPGHYDIRYEDLDSGLIRESPAFAVTIRQTERGEVFMGWTVPLYEDIRGETYHKMITEKEF